MIKLRFIAKIISLLLAINIVISSECPAVTCDTNKKSTANSTCINYNALKNSITLTKCLDHQRCFDFPIYKLTNYTNSQNMNNFSCTNYPLQLNGGIKNGLAKLGVEYDFCIDKNDCASMKCVKNICVGDNNSPCNNSNMCSARMYCDVILQKCQPRLQNGQYCTSDDYCINTSACFKNICITLNTLLSGTNLNSTIQSDSRFCISGWSNSENICEDLINTGQAPYLCDGINSMCNYTSSITNKTVSQYNCNCDIITRNAHCPLGTDTTQYLNYIEAKLNVLWNPCHYSNKGECYLVSKLTRYHLLNATFLWSGFTLLDSDYMPCLGPRSIHQFEAGACQNNTNKRCIKNTTNGGDNVYFNVLSLIIAYFIII